MEPFGGASVKTEMLGANDRAAGRSPIIGSPPLPQSQRYASTRPGAGAQARRWWSVATLVCISYVLFVLGWHALRYTPLAHWWPFELFDIFGLLLFAPLPLLMLLSMLCASRAAGLWLLALSAPSLYSRSATSNGRHGR